MSASVNASGAPVIGVQLGLLVLGHNVAVNSCKGDRESLNVVASPRIGRGLSWFAQFVGMCSCCGAVIVGGSELLSSSRVAVIKVFTGS